MIAVPVAFFWKPSNTCPYQELEGPKERRRKVSWVPFKKVEIGSLNYNILKYKQGQLYWIENIGEINQYTERNRGVDF